MVAPIVAAGWTTGRMGWTTVVGAIVTGCGTPAVTSVAKLTRIQTVSPFALGWGSPFKNSNYSFLKAESSDMLSQVQIQHDSTGSSGYRVMPRVPLARRMFGQATNQWLWSGQNSFSDFDGLRNSKQPGNIQVATMIDWTSLFITAGLCLGLATETPH